MTDLSTPFTGHVATETRRWLIGGRVQGVGFRPFVHRLAVAHGLRGWVQNRLGHVEIVAQGEPAVLELFARALAAEAPPLARPILVDTKEIEPGATLDGFEIRASAAGGRADIHVPPDYFACADCVRELRDPHNRRYRYPFINCTQCGPRYTLITRLPYDRPHTTMVGFTLCPQCRREYEDPLDRRFHAEPIACPTCGPSVWFVENGAVARDQTAIDACVAALKCGAVVAVKGVGGYHLICDARSAAAIGTLRARKPRPEKPLAVMFPMTGADGCERLCEEVAPTAAECAQLVDPMRPIVLVAKRFESALAHEIAPGLNEIGAFLPYSPLHHLLIEAFDAPLVVTSANVSGEPVLTDDAEVERRLGHVADAYLHHDRPIARPADDSVYRVIAGAARPLRLGRGAAPLELPLPFVLSRSLLAVGGHMKNTVALAWDDRAVVSPHIGDLDAPRSLEVFEHVIADMQSLYRVCPEAIVCDAHPGYASTRYARRSGVPVISVAHHRAHASALAGEHPDVARWLVFTWDGVGYGEDGTLWGGEALLGRPGAWRRVASMRPFRLPGGEKASREPWRSALGLCLEIGREWGECPQSSELLRHAWERRLNAPQTSAVGRLFDAAAALTGLHHRSSFEGQGPMVLEAAATGAAPPIALPLVRSAEGLYVTDWAPLVPAMLDATCTIGERSAIFHATLANVLRDQACAVRQACGDFVVGLSGGVFQNRRLTELAIEYLEPEGFDVRLALQLPCNDGGLSFGQLIEAGNEKG